MRMTRASMMTSSVRTTYQLHITREFGINYEKIEEVRGVKMVKKFILT